MDKVNPNPFLLFLCYILRCFIPLGLMLGVSYLLRRLGLIKEPPRPPAGWDADDNAMKIEGGITHD
jgi:hypothetical protein